MLRNLDPGKQPAGERHRFLLVDNPSLEVTSKLHAGYHTRPPPRNTGGSHGTGGRRLPAAVCHP
eukprot:7321027-Pyramimonas_sp.AAC.1